MRAGRMLHLSRRPVVAALGLAALFLLPASCDRTRRHEVMTYFFDGVPPLSGEMADIGSFDPNANGETRSVAAGGWVVHEAIKNCTDCHGARQRTSFSRKVILVAEPPTLCYTCHTEYATLEGWVHGPVATGDCLFCHEPHKTRNEFLLTSPVPELCYQCHLPEAIHAIEHHVDSSYAHCIDCHDGHASASRSLLNQAFLRQPAGSAFLADVRRRQYEQSLDQARIDLAQSRDILALVRTAAESVESGQLDQARAYLEVVVNSGLLTEAEQAKMAGLLERLVSLQQVEPGGADLVELGAALRQVQQQRSERARAIAESYYLSIKLYRAGRLAEARQGFLDVLGSGLLPEPVKKTVEQYLERINRALKEGPMPPGAS
ncbi:MAG: hypothetical protein JW993_00435 [Sedimentisphaerales bacterium]|nr:hypothetical protein [Sedimentisphaerales bacterium]